MSFDRLVDWIDAGELPTDQIHHSHFEDFREAPMETVQKLYARFGLDWSSVAEAEMRAALEANPPDRHGQHVYSRAELGADPEALRRLFARYQARFDVPSDD